MSYLNPDDEWFHENMLLIEAVNMRYPDGSTALKTGTWLQAVEHIEKSVKFILMQYYGIREGENE